MIKKWNSPDILIVNGDLIDGRQSKQGGAELITPDRNIQCEMAIEAIKEWNAKKIFMTYGCLTAGHRILKLDLQWIPVEQLKKGDKLLAFEENGANRLRRKWIESEVIDNIPFEDEVYRIELSDGTFLEANAEHPFLVKSTSRVYWKTVKQLSKSINKNGRGWLSFQRILPIWKENNSYKAGYIAGFFDGEGSLSQRYKIPRVNHPEKTLTIAATQKNNIVLNIVKKYLNQFNFKYSIYCKSYKRNSDLCNLQLKGGFSAILSFLGTFRPKRLLKKLDINKFNSLRTSYKDNTKIINIYPIGKKIVYGLSTTSKTYISEGFLSHNSPYHVSEQAEDFEFNIAKTLGAKIEGHLYLNIEGLSFDIRHKVSSSIIPHGRATLLLREMLWDLVKEAEKVGPRIDIVVRSHTHYYLWAEQFGRYAFITPGLQLAKGRFGSRECISNVDWGIIRLVLKNKEIIEKNIKIWRLLSNRPRIINIK